MDESGLAYLRCRVIADYDRLPDRGAEEVEEGGRKMNDLKLDGLTGKTIKEAEVDGFGIRMVFTDGAVFDYDASDGGYSQYELTEATAEAMQKQIDHIADSGKKVSIPCTHENDLISRKIAIEALRECQTYLFDEHDPDKKIELRSAERAIEDLPSAQPEQHKGHWIGGDGSYICSECNGSPMDFIDTMGASFDIYVETPMNYCPNCGADMRGGDE